MPAWWRILVPGFVLLWACAHMEAPSGGPEDKRPPQVSGVFPAPQSINLASNTEFYFQFDEWINNPVPRGSWQLSPPPVRNLKTEVNGDILRVYTQSPLDTLTTYTLSITRKMEDLHGNALLQPYTLVFATGPKLDSLTLGGVVYSPLFSRSHRDAIPLVGLYPIGEIRENIGSLQSLRDSNGVLSHEPLLDKERPYYVAAPDSSGQFFFQGLRSGTYRMVAFQDANNNQRPDVIDELTALNTMDIHLLDGVQTPDQYLHLSDMDTSALQLVDVQPEGQNRLAVKTNYKATKESALERSHYRLLHNDSTIEYPQKIWLNPRNGEPILSFSELVAGQSYTLFIDSLVDSLGRQSDTLSNYLLFSWAEQKADSTTPVRISNISPGASRVLMPGDSITVSFNLPYEADNWI
jgi:hypothetical protein